MCLNHQRGNPMRDKCAKFYNNLQTYIYHSPDSKLQGTLSALSAHQASKALQKQDYDAELARLPASEADPTLKTRVSRFGSTGFTQYP